SSFVDNGERSLDKVFPPEEDSSETIWKTAVGINVHRSGIVNIDLIMSGRNNFEAVGFARCCLKSDSDQQVSFSILNDDACLIILNGSEIFRDAGKQENAPYESSFTAQLRQGNNILLVKKIDIGHNKKF
ncbi:MAG: hypothetical protein ACYTFY_19070, partial [Planctomycetota bacterium]